MNKETIVWSKDGCAFCERAKNMLNMKGIKFEERNITSGGWSKEQLLESVPQARTVPQIFLYGQYVGGFDKLAEYFESHGMWEN